MIVLPSLCRAILIAALLAARTADAVPLADFLKDERPPATAVYVSGGSAEQSLKMFAPADAKPGDRRPAVLCIHGGAWVAGSAEAFFPHARYFASRGMVAFSINYRLETASGTGLPECLQDCKAAVRYVRAHAAEMGIDPKRVAVLGDSAGGHLAAALGTVNGFDGLPVAGAGDLSAVPDAMVLCNPIVDLTDGDWPKYVIQGAALDKHATPEAKVMNPAQQALARQLSPLFQVRPGEPPTLLMHGLDDHVVDPAQARRFAGAMKAAGNRCDLVLIEGARHAFIMPKYTATEAIVVSAICQADQFFVSLGWLTGPPTLEVSDPPAWTVKSK
jgi:acetyl esterase/lipase